ncbi:MAG TPA: hypothetical protein VLZ73_05640 [Brevundimonas sp.]|nr:hypothetical protein [Brevundimonas sp.]
MSEDPRAKRNRGNRIGLWLLSGLAVLVLILVIAAVLKPTPAPPDHAAVAALLEADQQRVERPRPPMDAVSAPAATGAAATE